MNRYIIILFCLFYPAVLYGQHPRVPERIRFADMDLRLNNRVREEIQLDVNALTKSERYFNIKLARAKQYFPIIERIFREESVPEDFKYLVIQESALIPDAISSANAIGFWQFKIPAGREVGLRIDDHIDERMNIVSSTHGAAKYLKKNNFYFDNWLYALLAYNTGYGGAQSEVDPQYFGKKRMDINRRTHWYVKKFLAHKIAFEYAFNAGKHLDLDILSLYEYRNGGRKSLTELAREFNVEPKQVEDYNKWLRRGTIPLDKPYTVIIPGADIPSDMLARRRTSGHENEEKDKAQTQNELEDFSPDRKLYPVIEKTKNSERIVRINGIPGVVARPEEAVQDLLRIGEIPKEKFLAFNDIENDHEVVPGQVYYFKRKKNMAKEYYHTVFPDETSWSISQKYGIKEKKLLRKNRFRQDNVNLKPGRVLWIRHIRPDYYPVEYVKLPEDALKVVDSPAIAELDDKKRDNSMEDLNPEEKTDSKNKNTDEYVTETDEVNETNAPYYEPVTSIPDFHIVEPGETLFAISRKYRMNIHELLRINDLKMDSNINIGDKIFLKEDADANSESEKNLNKQKNSYMIYTVKRGDTMYSISRQFNVKVEDIMEWNLKNDYSLDEGEKLKIKRKN